MLIYTALSRWRVLFFSMSNSELEISIPNKEFDLTNQVSWLRDLYVDDWASIEVLDRVDRGLEVAETLVMEANDIADIVRSKWFTELRSRIESIGGEKVISAEILCIDGRFGNFFRNLPGAISRFPTPAGIIATTENRDGEFVPSSQILNLAVRNRKQAGKEIVEFVGPHTSFRHNLDADHPAGCGAWNGELKERLLEPTDFSDAGLAEDLVRNERVETRLALENIGANVVTRIIDTDTQGLVFIGDEALNEISSIMTTDEEYRGLTPEVINEWHRQGRVIYTPMLVGDINDFFLESSFSYGSIDWEDSSLLKENLTGVVGLTERLMNSDFGKELINNANDLYNSKFSDQVIREITSNIAYNTCLLWLSGFDNEENVPTRYRHHEERFGVIGDKGFDYWIKNSPFLIGCSESVEDVLGYLKTTMSLLPQILKEAHKVDLKKEAMVMCVTQPIDPNSSSECKGRATAGMAELYLEVLKFFERKKLVSEGKIILIPMLVNEKSREVVEVPNFRHLYSTS